MTCPTCGRVHGCDDPDHTKQECEAIIAKLQAQLGIAQAKLQSLNVVYESAQLLADSADERRNVAYTVPQEYCHICGYNSGSSACSRMHKDPESMTPMHRELADAIERGDAARRALSRICDVLGVSKDYAEWGDGLGGEIPLDERTEIALTDIARMQRLEEQNEAEHEAGADIDTRTQFEIDEDTRRSRERLEEVARETKEPTP